jgi:hypothetical protein
MSEHPQSDRPVYIGEYNPQDRERYVHVVQPSGETVRGLIGNLDELAAFVERVRPGTNIDDPEQVHWVDHPGEWTGL